MAEEAEGELLSRYYRVADGEESDAILKAICGAAWAIARKVVLDALATRLRDEPSLAEDVDSLTSEAVDLLRAQLVKSKESGTGHVTDIKPYLKTIARNVCLSYLDWQKSNRGRLRDALRFTLKYDSEFALWTLEKLKKLGWLGGLCDWHGREPVSITPVKTADAEAFELGCDALASLRHGQYMKVAPELLFRSFRLSRGPLVFNDLVSALVDHLGITEAHVISGDAPQGEDGPSIIETLASTTRSPEASARVMEQLSMLWPRMKQLRPDWIRVLVLNPKDDGDSCIIADRGIASIGEMAEAMGWPPERLAALWDQLPLEESRIAVELGCSLKRVAYFRFSAKDALRLQAHGKKKKSVDLD